MRRLEILPVRVAVLDQAGHIHLSQRPGVRGRAHAADHMVGNLTAYGGDAHELFPGARAGGAGGRTGIRGRRGPLGRQVRDNVVAGQPAARAGGRDLRELHAILLSETLHRGADLLDLGRGGSAHNRAGRGR